MRRPLDSAVGRLPLKLERRPQLAHSPLAAVLRFAPRFVNVKHHIAFAFTNSIRISKHHLELALAADSGTRARER